MSISTHSFLAWLAVLLVADANQTELTTQSGVLYIPPISSHVYCAQQIFPEAFSTAPRIIVTPTHRRFDQNWTHHAISAWSEHANKFEFRVCLRKMVPDQATSKTSSNTKCAFEDPDRLFRTEGIKSAAKCKAQCASTANCNFYSWGTAGSTHPDVCMGCEQGITEQHAGFEHYALESEADVDSTVSVEWFAWTGDTLDSAEATGFVTPSLRKGTSCFTRKFDQHFETPPLVVGSIDHTNIYTSLGHRHMTHNAIASWVEGITRTQFEVCFSESSHHNVGGHRPLTFNYIAFDKSHTTSFSDAHGRSAALAGGDERFDGTKCTVVRYGKPFVRPPFVIATVNHHDSQGGHESLVTWTEEVGTESFRFCGREMEFTDGSHDGNVYVDWAVISMDGLAPVLKLSNDAASSLSISNTGSNTGSKTGGGGRDVGGPFHCDYTANFIHPISPWASPFAYTQVDLTTRNGGSPVYGTHNSNSHAVAYCKQQCEDSHQTCTGFFFQQRRTGQEVCGFYSADLAGGNWVAHGHKAGAICQRSPAATTVATAASELSASASHGRRLRGRRAV